MAEWLDSSAAPIVDPYIGLRLLNFVVKHKLAEGGMGAIYVIEHENNPNIQRALKVVLSGPAAIPEVQARFLREAKATAALDHDNIISIENYGALPSGLGFYLVLPLLKGESLEALLRRGGPQTEHFAGTVLFQVLDALKCAHTVGIIHRDLKPGNIFLERTKDSDFHVQLLDFGIARVPEAVAKSPITKEGMIVGTPVYMAPEQIAGQSSPQSDLFSTAVVLFQMITGRLPWGEDDPLPLYFAQKATRPERPSEMSPALWEVVSRGLAFDPSARHLSAQAFAVAIASALPAIPEARVPSGAEIMGRVARGLLFDDERGEELTLRNVSDADHMTPNYWLAPPVRMPLPPLNVNTSSGVPQLSLTPPALTPKVSERRPVLVAEATVALSSKVNVEPRRRGGARHTAAVTLAVGIAAAGVIFGIVRIATPRAPAAGVPVEIRPILGSDTSTGSAATAKTIPRGAAVPKAIPDEPSVLPARFKGELEDGAASQTTSAPPTLRPERTTVNVPEGRAASAPVLPTTSSSRPRQGVQHRTETTRDAAAVLSINASRPSPVAQEPALPPPDAQPGSKKLNPNFVGGED